MKFNLSQIKKTEQVIFKGMQDIPKDKVGITKLVNDITDTSIYFMIYNAKAYVDTDFLARKLELSKSQIFSMTSKSIENIL